MEKTPRILIVDDEPGMRASLGDLLEREGFAVETAQSGSAALALMVDTEFDLYLLDVCMPEMDGFQLAERINLKDPASVVVMMTGNATVDSAVMAMKKGAYEFFSVPSEFDDVKKIVQHGLEKRKLKIENRRMQEKLRLSERRYRYLVENSPDIIYTLDAQGRFTFVNEAVERLLGLSSQQLLGQPYQTILAEEDHAKAQWIFNERRTIPRAKTGTELRLVSNKTAQTRKQPETDYLFIELKSTGIYDRSVSEQDKTFLGTYGVGRDISYRRRLERELRQAQKMEAIGTLAGGIAHDFNNLLMGIQGYTSLMLVHQDPGDANHKKLLNIEHHVQSGAQLTRQLLGFARGGKNRVKAVNLNHLLRRSASMFGRAKKEIKIIPRFQEEIWPVEIDEGQIKQVLLNLYVNAWQAMPGGGDLYLETENVLLEHLQAEDAGLAVGRYVRISVADTGIGMDEEVRQRIFEPFFTTKQRGRGTGLGLASAYGIIQNHGGNIKAYSKKGGGSTFVFYLPVSEKDYDAAAPKFIDIIPGSETVILVDDEEQVLSVTGEMLESLGYTVLTARSGSEALDLLNGRLDQIDLFILDIIMPGMGGGETFDRIKQIKPGVKVLLSSGYSLDQDAAEIIGRGGDGFIQKPYNLAQLSRKISEIMGRREA